MTFDEHRPMRLSACLRIFVLVLALSVPGCSAQTPENDPGQDGDASNQETSRPDRQESDLLRGDTIPGRPSWTREDLAILEATVLWALDAGLDTLSMGERLGRIGERFVGTAYLPQTLDPLGDERLVVNLRAFDCVTFVESMMALAKVVGATDRSSGPPPPGRLMDDYERALTAIRYRGGRLQGYPSRLHYFSEWIADNEAKGLVLDVTADLGGVPDPEPPTFMTGHRDSYWQLADASNFEAITEVERSLAGRPRFMIPEDRVQDIASGIRTGDIIAATSTLPGLDVAHTGIALRRDGVLRLMHAPLVGEAVQISERPLAERLMGLATQDGIMVARPVDPRPPAG